MDLKSEMVIIKGIPKDDIENIIVDKTKQKTIVTYRNNKSYEYNIHNVCKLSKPKTRNIDKYIYLDSKGKIIKNIEKCLEFEGSEDSYLRFFFINGKVKSYCGSEVFIHDDPMSNKQVENLLGYYEKISEITGIKIENKNILKEKFLKIRQIKPSSILAKYLEASDGEVNDDFEQTFIYPFGCNLSQIDAIRSALSNQISIIQGPPGTGKTQTILNIIANLILNGQNVAVVSNNNSATKNVYEKLEKYGYEFLAAELGSGENKSKFILEKQKSYPDFTGFLLDDEEYFNIQQSVAFLEDSLLTMLDRNNKISKLNQNISSLKVEQKYFNEAHKHKFENIDVLDGTRIYSSDNILRLWNALENSFKGKKKISFILKLKYLLIYRININKYFKINVDNLIAYLKSVFYEYRISELKKEKGELKSLLKDYKFEEKLDELNFLSEKILKHAIARKYTESERVLFTDNDLTAKNEAVVKEYPVILSSTYSVISTLGDFEYDYVIVDEASQVDLVTGVLTMGCAKNIVVVGDLKQLPNVITKEEQSQITDLSETNFIPNQYRYEEHSLLSSVASVFINAPKTLLREHYRCHPKIIEFCNRKFYNNELLIMTQDNDEKDVLSVLITVEGNHARGHKNMRQIDEIKNCIIPELNSKDLGIITPYRAQSLALKEEIDDEIQISTVHKFQGRENNDIIISTVDNEITEFTDNPNMLNVAVSRAKNRLRLVISNSDNKNNTNIGDLVKYIKYNNFEVENGEVFSVFDLLYKSYDSARQEFLRGYKKVSDFDSENLMYATINKLLSQEGYTYLDVVTHMKLCEIFKNMERLNVRESDFVNNPLSHVDFVIFDKIDKSIVLAIEVDGYKYHQEGSEQKKRDIIKDEIFAKYKIPLIRFNTTGSGEYLKLKERIDQIIHN